MNNPIKDIVAFNQKAGLLSNGYSDQLESSFLVEEALEGFDISKLEPLCFQPYGYYNHPQQFARDLFASLPLANISDVDRLDKACDAVVYAIGSMAKLGLNANQITRALNAVCDANKAKLKMPKDHLGKLTKPTDFIGPEAKLQEILDEVQTQISD